LGMATAGDSEGIGITRTPVTDLTAVAKKIMELFNYFKISAGDTPSLKLFLTRKHLWKDLAEEEVQDALMVT